jgi:hypothetical protein
MDTSTNPAPRGLDIASFNASPEADVGYTLQLVHPATGAPLGASITIAGEESERMQEWSRRLFERVQRDERLAKKAGRQIERSFDELQEQLVQKAAALTLAWSGMLMDGRPAEFTPANVERVYRAQRWLRDLVLEEARVLGNFVKR